MSQLLLQSLQEQDGVVLVDAENAPTWLEAGTGRLSVLFFAGDPDKRLETADVAVVLRELLRSEPDRLRAAMVAPQAEAVCMKAFGVGALPSLVFFAGERRLEVIPKIQDWSVYAEKLPDLLRQAYGEEVSA